MRTLRRPPSLYAIPILLTTFTSPGADKNGVAPSAISLPSGPGSIEGLGEAFQPSLNSGATKYNLTLDTPPGVAAHRPKLSLNYDGASGNGILGFGWSLPIPYIQRQTEKGIPRYLDQPNELDDDGDGQIDELDELDTYINDMKEELVLQSDGYWFCENEGAFIRYERQGDYWVGTLPTGARMEFGVEPTSRIHDQETDRTFRWLLTRLIDTHGNAIEYHYTQFAGENNLNQVYCEEIRYGPGAGPWTHFQYIKFVYQDRSDWIEDGRSGFLVRTGKRLRSIVQGIQGPENLLGHSSGDYNADGTQDFLTRRYNLSYKEGDDGPTHWSLLESIELIGADDTTALPPTRFGYILCDPSTNIQVDPNELLIQPPPFTPENDFVELVDLNGDALPDLLRTEAFGGAHSAVLNQGETASGDQFQLNWSSPVEIASADRLAWNIDLRSTTTIGGLIDITGDGIADLTYHTAAGDTFYFPNSADLQWGPRRPLSVQDAPPPSPYSSPTVHSLDVNFDKRMDILQSVSTGFGADYRYWLNLGGDTYARTAFAPQAEGIPLDIPGTHIADLNGDRIPDIARIRPASIETLAGLGYARYTPKRTISIPDALFDSQQIQSLRFQDINGDGLSDLVLERANPGSLWFWLNLGNHTFGSRRTLSGLPPTISLNATTRWADINGNGTTDLLYFDSQSAQPFIAIDIGRALGCAPKPNLLVGISNGIGRITHIEYKPSTDYLVNDAANGEPWTQILPFPISVVSKTRTKDSLGNTYTTEFEYHDGYYDPEEKEFRGFARARQIDIGDDSAPTRVTENYFNTGSIHEALKGKLERSVTRDANGDIFTDAITQWTIPPRILMTGVNGQPVHFSSPTQQDKSVIEKGNGAPKRLRSTFEYDNYGNQTRVADYGLIQDEELTFANDERITTTDYAINTEKWLLRYPSRTELSDENGVVLSREEIYYDDPTYSGNNFGNVQVGDPTLNLNWIDASIPADFVLSSRSEFDEYGNATLLLDPLAEAPNGVYNPESGHAHEIVYDPDYHTFPIRERIHIGNSKPALELAVEYDPSFGQIIRSTDFNGNPTTYVFDALSRLTSLINPGDTPEFPTAEYRYVLAESFATDRLINYVETRLLDKESSTLGAREDRYYISRKFTDGLGRLVQFKHEGEDGTVVVKDSIGFNARGTQRYMLNPYFSVLEDGGILDRLHFEDITAPEWRGRFAIDAEIVALEDAPRTLSAYDATLRPTTTTYPDGATAEIQYRPFATHNFDPNDLDPNSPHFGTPTIYENDGLGRHIRTIERVNLSDTGETLESTNDWITTATYDLNDQLIQLKDAQANVWRYEYDGLQRLTAAHDTNRGSTSFTFDEASNLRETIDAKGQTIRYTHDGANRVIATDYLDHEASFSYGHNYNPESAISLDNRPDVAYFYDTPFEDLPLGDQTRGTPTHTRGLMTAIWDPTGEEHLSYDARGRLAWRLKRVDIHGTGDLISYLTRYEYDSADRLTQITFPDNDAVEYSFNDRNLIESIQGPSGVSIISQLNYAPAELKRHIVYGNGVSTSYGYDRRLRLASLRSASPRIGSNDAPGDLIDFTYQLDGASNIQWIRDHRPRDPESTLPIPPNGSKSFAFDALYRLSQATYNPSDIGETTSNSSTLNYQYDRIGNLLSKKLAGAAFQDNPPTQTFSIGGDQGAWSRDAASDAAPGPHAVTTATQSSESSGFSYDSNGNMAEFEGFQLTWDFLDRLVRAESEEWTFDFRYDHKDRRILKHKRATADDTPSETTIYVDKSFEIRPNSQPVKYVWLGETRVAQITQELSPRPIIQRISVNAGWNLVSTTLSATDLWTQLSAHQPNGAPIVQAVYVWKPESQNYSILQDANATPAGTTLWIQATRDATLSITGEPTQPGPTTLPPGANFYASGIADAVDLSSFFTDGAAIWKFNAFDQSWTAPRIADLASAPPPPMPTYPGESIVIRSENSINIPAPETARRILYYIQDHLGSTAHATDAEGDSVEERGFLPFGSPIPGLNNQAKLANYGFAQKESDTETNLQYFEARYLASPLARFITCDPIINTAVADRLGAPQALHAYAYAANNPLTRKDSMGLDPKETSWGDAIGDVWDGAWGYAKEKVVNTVDYVTENPAKSSVAILSAPAWIGPAMIYGVGATAYGGTEDLLEAATGDDFDSGGYKQLNDTERRQKLGRGLAQGAEVLVDIAGAKSIDAPKPPKLETPPTKGFTPKPHAKAQPDAPPAHVKTTASGAKAPAEAAGSAAHIERLNRHMKKMNWILERMEETRKANADFIARGGEPAIIKTREASQVKIIMEAAEKRFGFTF